MSANSDDPASDATAALARSPTLAGIDRAMAAVERAAMALGALSILAMGGLVTGSVIGRAVFNHSIPDDILMAGLLVVPVVVLPLAYIQRADGHICVTVTTDWLPERAKAVLRLIGCILGIGFFGAMGWFLFQKVPGEFAQGLYYDGQLDIPYWPMKAVFAAGILLFVLRLLLSIAAEILTIIRPARAAGASSE
ncbi:MAG: TRAP transporter small permease [Alphaproteobacteria bacterium]|nr:TRAP transporter small permease [Alphaproteobacteria bacterium]